MTTNRKKVIQKIFELKQDAENNGYMTDYVDITFDLKGHRTLGQYYPSSVMKNRQHKIRLHSELLEEFGDVYIENTVIHEYAHLITEINFPFAKAHGKEWKMICEILGLKNPKATTSVYNSSKILKEIKGKRTRKQTFYTYKCNCREWELSSIRHSRIHRGAIYSCPSCKHKLKAV